MSTWTSGRRPITIAILAMGGEGGGVLADWIVAVGEQAGFHAQNTSVAGVAQRTGATVYYVELLPGQRASRRRCPGRAGAQPLPDARRGRRRHRLRADGGRPRRPARLLHPRPHHSDRLDQPRLRDGREARTRRRPRGQQRAARRRAVAVRRALGRAPTSCSSRSDAGSVISASLFGALAGSGALPVDRAPVRGRRSAPPARAWRRRCAPSRPATTPHSSRQPEPQPRPAPGSGAVPVTIGRAALSTPRRPRPQTEEQRRRGRGPRPASRWSDPRLPRTADGVASRVPGAARARCCCTASSARRSTRTPTYADRYLDRVARLAAVDLDPEDAA